MPLRLQHERLSGVPPLPDLQNFCYLAVLCENPSLVPLEVTPLEGDLLGASGAELRHRHWDDDLDPLLLGVHPHLPLPPGLFSPARDLLGKVRIVHRTVLAVLSLVPGLVIVLPRVLVRQDLVRLHRLLEDHLRLRDLLGSLASHLVWVVSQRQLLVRPLDLLAGGALVDPQRRVVRHARVEGPHSEAAAIRLAPLPALLLLPLLLLLLLLLQPLPLLPCAVGPALPRRDLALPRVLCPQLSLRFLVALLHESVEGLLV
mmetsp:Transcript_4594/g.13929  ORF Transcript_4594/g.13929 Transcript_4594/m.13929 type:complete len:259 (-) Transcript_4594:182-958(-)